MTKRVLTLFAVLALAASACGTNSGSVLERIPDDEKSPGDGTNVPPETHLRMDVFFLRDVVSCAQGDPCGRNNDPDSRGNDSCLEFEDGSGYRFGFRLDTLEFLRPSDPRVGPDAFCFHLVIDDQEMASLNENLSALRNLVYGASGEEIVLDWVAHPIANMEASFVRYENEWGIFLETEELEPYAADLRRETDFVMAVNGARDPATGVMPLLEHCAGTNRELEDGLAGAGYTWLTTECNRVEMFLRHWMFQIGVALRDANPFNDLYDHDYPPCGEASDRTADWWPNPDECSRDPDAPTCGDNRCEGTDDDYVQHVLTDHWPRGRDFVGNHCRNGRRDFNEMDVDEGGACALLPE